MIKEAKMSQNPKTENKKTSNRIINSICIIVIIASLAGLIYYSLPYIRQYFKKEAVASIAQPTAEDTGVDFDALKAVNPDTVGWIKIEGTSIDYPVVQTDNNEKYLYTTFEGEESQWGAVFLDYTDNFNRMGTATISRNPPLSEIFTTIWMRASSGRIRPSSTTESVIRGNGRSSLSTKPKPTMTTGAPILRVTRTSSLISSASRTAVSIKRT